MTQVLEGRGLIWPGQAGVVLVVTPGTGQGETLRVILQDFMASIGQGVLVTANRPANVLRDDLLAGGVDLAALHIIDCVSSLGGILPAPQPGVLHVESPTLLEKLVLRVDQALRGMRGPRFVVVDSLSALAIYNGNAMVTELAHVLVNRLRSQPVVAALLVDRQGRDNLQDAVLPLCDGVIRL